MSAVLVPFPYAGNGFTIEQLVPGDDRDFGDLTAGLVAAGLVADTDAPASKPKAGKKNED